MTNPAGQNTTFVYDLAGQVTQVSSPSGKTVQYGYDLRGLLTTLTDPLGNQVRYEYEALARKTKEFDAPAEQRYILQL